MTKRNGDKSTRICIHLHSAFTFLLLVLAGARATHADDDFPRELVEFAPYEHNPVFTGSGEGHWDANIRERGWILREQNVYKMWFTGYDGSRDGPMSLGYATSPDGLTWTRFAANPIYRDHWVEDMMIVKREGTYYMFAEGLNDRAQLLRSPDGLHWRRVGRLDVRYTSGRPLDAGPYGTPTAWWEDGTWSLFYERGDRGVWLARSTDMAVWTNVQDEPVLKPGQGSHDEDMIALNQIIKYNGRYYAYYHGSGPGEPRLWTTNVAVSTDLVHWKNYPGNPLFPVAADKSSGIVVHDGKRFRLYTMHRQVDVHISKNESPSLRLEIPNLKSQIPDRKHSPDP